MNDDEEEEEEEEEEKIPQRLLEELRAFFLLHKEDDDGVVAASLTVSLDDETNEKNETKKNLSATPTAVRARIHEFVRKEGKNKFGSRTIETTNQIRVFRKKDYFSNNKEVLN